MHFDHPPGSGFGCNINAHRSQWNGQVCRAASSWICGAKQEFRDDHCERGNPRCYHLQAFSELDPCIVIDDNGGSWLFGGEPEAFDDQILLLWGGNAIEPRGIREAAAPILFGAYRVKRVEARPRGSFVEWVVYPYSNGWTRIAGLRLPVPRWESLPGPYLKQVDRSAIELTFERASEKVKEPNAAIEGPDLARFQNFAKELPNWLDIAAKRMQDIRKRTASSTPAYSAASGPTMVNRPLKGLAHLVRPSERPAVVTPTSPAPRSGAPVPSASTSEVLEGSVQERIAARHGPGVLETIRIGWLTKPLLILRGGPGVGKSDLACSLIEDSAGDRVLTVAVDPTWRGREDLLGHVNPIDGWFVPTAVTELLHRAEKAWDAGDRLPFLLVFEEFNLSQPEHWLSELLVRSQYVATNRNARTIRLGGKRVTGWGEKEEPRVFLAPSVRMVATINSDHTVRALSPRVLDRAAVVTLAVQPHEALRRVGLELEKQELDAIADLDFRMRQRGAVFSYRTAESLKACLGRLSELGVQRSRALDLVLVQEVLSKVRLLAADPADQRLCDELAEWTETTGKGLLECQRVIAGWSEALQSGEDVQQT